MKRRTVLSMGGGAALMLGGAAGRPVVAFEDSKNVMRYRGVVYDVGLRFTPGGDIRSTPSIRNSSLMT